MIEAMKRQSIVPTRTKQRNTEHVSIYANTNKSTRSLEREQSHSSRPGFVNSGFDSD